MTKPRKPATRRECGARLPSGRVCRSVALKGADRCRKHGGLTQQAAAWTASMDAAGRDAIEARMRDPGIFDTRRPVALAEHVAASAPLVPSEAALYRSAKRMVARSVGPELVNGLHSLLDRAAKEGADGVVPLIRAFMDELMQVTPEDMEGARIGWAETSINIAEKYGKTQAAAMKSTEVAALVSEKILPLLAAYTLETAKIVRRYVDPKQHDKLLAELRRAAQVSVGQITTAVKA